MTRRMFGWVTAVGAGGLCESALAQRALPQGVAPPGTIWLNANENPDGPPRAAIEALTRVAPDCGRYGFQYFRDLDRAIAAADNLDPAFVVSGAGSTEVLNAAVAAFTSDVRPLIAPDPTFEVPAESARALGRPVVTVPLTQAYAADVKRLAAEASKAGGGLIYVCNPNNPTSSMTPRQDVRWLAANLPAGAVLIMDEAYIHFAENFEEMSALEMVREGKDVIVTRTFSKIYGMAGLRIGYACGKPELIRRVRAFRNNAISFAGLRAAMAALDAGPSLVAERRARLLNVRSSVCGWLRGQGLEFIEPHASFVMIETRRDAREIGFEMFRRGVAVGRPFPPLTTMLRVTLGTQAEMTKFREIFASVMRESASPRPL